jgi:hypothetical protein
MSPSYSKSQASLTFTFHISVFPGNAISLHHEVKTFEIIFFVLQGGSATPFAAPVPQAPQGAQVHFENIEIISSLIKS